jgi:hypothetical protein
MSLQTSHLLTSCCAARPTDILLSHAWDQNAGKARDEQGKATLERTFKRRNAHRFHAAKETLKRLIIRFIIRPLKKTTGEKTEAISRKPSHSSPKPALEVQRLIPARHISSRAPQTAGNSKTINQSYTSLMRICSQKIHHTALWMLQA